MVWWCIRGTSRIGTEPLTGQMRRLAKIWADAGYGGQLIDWIVERTFAWLGQCRRLSKDYAHLVTSATAFIPRHDSPDAAATGAQILTSHTLSKGWGTPLATVRCETLMRLSRTPLPAKGRGGGPGTDPAVPTSGTAGSVSGRRCICWGK